MPKYGYTICLGCGETIEKHSPTTKRCKSCALKAHGQTGRGYSERICVLCNLSYKPTNPGQKSCPSCAAEYRRIGNVERLRALRAANGNVPIGTEKTCSACGVGFTYTSGPQHRCETCQRAAETAATMDWLNKNNERVRTVYMPKARDNYSFGGMKSKTLERDNFTCQHCGSSENLHIHHIDKKGSNVPKEQKNNALDNLITLCRSCHTRVHFKRHYSTCAPQMIAPEKPSPE